MDKDKQIAWLRSAVIECYGQLGVCIKEISPFKKVNCVNNSEDTCYECIERELDKFLEGDSNDGI